jgi:RNA polymerase sigma-70 factor (ECF subfamily)
VTQVGGLAAFLAQRRALLSYATSLMGDASSAEDIVQEAWLRVQDTDTRSTADAVTHPIRYLYRVVRNLAIDEKRSARVRRVISGDIHDMDDISSEQPNPEQNAMSRQALAIVQQVLDGLPERHRTVFMLYRFEGLKMQEIGRRLRISVGLVHRLIHDVMARCEDALEAPSPDRSL